MKIAEVINGAAEQGIVQPSVLAQQARVGKVVKQIAASDAAKPASEMDKVLAMRQMATMKKQTDKGYAQRLRQQLASAEAQLNSVNKFQR
jgi:hypothetical protein